MKTTITFLFSIVTILFAFCAKAQGSFNVTSGSIAQTSIDSCSSTNVTVNTYLGCINWTMGPSSFSVSGTSIVVRVDYTSSFICAGAISNPIFTQAVQNLSPANYSVTAAAYLDGVFVNSVSVGNLAVTTCITTAINSAEVKSDLKMYPNPASEFLMLDNFSGKQQTFQLFDLSGRLALSGVVKVKTTKVDLSNLSPGIYFMKYEVNNEQSVKKIIVR